MKQQLLKQQFKQQLFKQLFTQHLLKQLFTQHLLKQQLTQAVLTAVSQSRHSQQQSPKGASLSSSQDRIIKVLLSSRC